MAYHAQLRLFIDNLTALRALQNPALFTSEHYKQAAIAVAAGIAIRLAISIPVQFPEQHPPQPR
jgi:hypothetical protein